MVFGLTIWNKICQGVKLEFLLRLEVKASGEIPYAFNYCCANQNFESESASILRVINHVFNRSGQWRY